MSDIDIGISDIGSSYEKYFFIMNFILLEIDSRCPLGSVFSKISQPLTFFFPYGSERSFFNPAREAREIFLSVFAVLQGENAKKVQKRSPGLVRFAETNLTPNSRIEKILKLTLPRN